MWHRMSQTVNSWSTAKNEIEENRKWEDGYQDVAEYAQKKAAKHNRAQHIEQFTEDAKKLFLGLKQSDKRQPLERRHAGN